MSKKAKTKQNSTSEAGPWPYAVPQAKQFTDQLGAISQAPGAIGVTPTQSAAFKQLETNASAGNPYAGNLDALAQQGFAGAAAGANPANYTGMSTDAYKTLQGQLGDYASGKYLDPMSNPQMRAMLDQVSSDVGNRINAQFAGAGRDLSGANQMAYGKGVTAAQLPLLLDQYNRAQDQQMQAAQTLYGAGNQTATTNSGLDAARLAARQSALGMGQTAAGIGQQAMDAKNYAANSLLDLGQQQKAMPFEDMSLWASLLFPAAGLGGTEISSGSAKTKTGLFSDARLKDDIKPVGELADGQRVYSYHYKDDPDKTTHIGLLAQEAETKAPSGAVGVDRATGFRVVDYDAATKKAAEIVAKRRGVK